MSWWDDVFGKAFRGTDKLDPLGHAALKKVVGNDSHVLNVTTGHLTSLFGGNKTLVGHWMNDLHNESGRNVADPVRGIGRGVLTAGAVFGAMYGAGALGAGGGTGAGTGAAGDAAGVGSGAGAGTGAGAGAYTSAAADSQAANASLGLGANTGSVPAAVDLGTAGGVTETGVGSGAYEGAAQDSQLYNQQVNASPNEGSVPKQVQVDGQDYDNSQTRQPPPRSVPQQSERSRGLPPLPEHDAEYDPAYGGGDYGYGDFGGTQPSSRKFKTPVKGATGLAIRRGLTGADPISANGVHIAAIKALTQELAGMQKQIDALKQRRKA